MVLAVPLEYAKSCFRLIPGGGGLGIKSIFVDSVCQAVMFVVRWDYFILPDVLSIASRNVL